jgi:pyruvate,water dikinase
MCIENDVYSQYEAAQALEVMQKEYPEQTHEQMEEVRGVCAYPGKVRGKVKLLYDAREMNKIEPGDILVCEATNPDLVIAMGRAGAIVTNEGGITSHAAIVSREMKIPCVIGTKIATKIFKDGDLVEVDAETGIVKKLS